MLSMWSTLMAQTYKVGDLYTAPDGSKGIVYYLHPDGSGGWVVALTDASSGCSWGELVDVPGLYNYNLQNSNYHVQLLNDTAGFTNTQILRNYQNNNSFAAGVVDFVHGWMLPSPAQLRTLYAQMHLFGPAVYDYGWVDLSHDYEGSYWTSAEKNASKAYRVNFDEGYILDEYKTTSSRVRAVRSFSYSVDYAAPVLNYLWSTGENTSDIVVNPSHTTAYTITVSTSAGCSDVAEQVIVVNEVSNTEITQMVCDSYTWNDTTYTESGDYQQAFTVANGCDSVVTLHLTVNYSTHNVETETSCGSYDWHGMTCDTSGTYIYAYENGEGCPSADTLHLTIKTTYHEDLHVTACDEYEWYGETYIEGGEYEQVFTAANGCDSVVTLHLTIIPLPELIHTPDTTIISGTSAALWASGAEVLYWTDGNGNILASGPSLTVSPATSTRYYLTGQNYSAAVGNNLVVNGDFEQGNVSFGSAYHYIASTTYMLEGYYSVGLNARNFHTGFYNWPDHTTGTGNYMIINGAETPNTNVWTQTVAVTPNTDYSFSTWVCSVGGGYQQPEELAQLQFSVNGSQLGDIFTAPDAYGVWNHYYEVWNSGDNTSAVITILNQNTAAGGNDFGIDDIVFAPLVDCSVTDSILVTVSYNAADERTICDSELPYEWNGVIFEHADTVEVVLEALSGADSVVTLHLTVNATYHEDLHVTVCDEYVWYGETYLEGGEYEHVFTAANGCDSVETLHLTIIPLPELRHTPDTTIISGTSAALWASGPEVLYWTDGNGNILASGPSLTVSPATSTRYYLAGQNYSASASNNLVVNGDFELGNMNFSSSYTYSDDLYPAGVYYVGLNGHDYHTGFYNWPDHTSGTGNYMIINGAETPNTNVWTQTVEVSPNTDYAFSTWVCSIGGNPQDPTEVAQLQFSVNGNQLGNIFTAPNTYGVWSRYYEVWNSGDNTSAVLTILNQNTAFGGNDFGIDDIVFAPLTECSVTDSILVTVSYYAADERTICDSELPYEWNGVIFEHADTVEVVLEALSGADSVVTLHFNVNYATHQVSDTSVCDSYKWHGMTCDTSGTYIYTYENGEGCPSADTLHLTVKATYHENLYVTACDEYEWCGETYMEDGEYDHVFTGANGCDSVVTLHLSLNTTSANTLSVNIVENNLPFTLNDSSYTLPGTYYQHFTNAAGCDSMLTIGLAVYYNQTVEVDSTVCESALPITWNNVTFTQAGTLSDTLNTSHGADSIVVMTLNVLPSPEAVISGLVALCSDSVVTLTADSAYSYLWSTGDTTRIITVTGEGAYTLTVTNEYGCTATANHYLMPLGNPIISVTVPEMCAGGSYLLSVGFQPDNNIHLGQGATTLSLTDTIYLPDGVYCEPYGCSYRSPLTFTAYADGDTIQSADDIYYVRLNMEHSYVGDLYINITCPNGQKADLLKYGGIGNSECNSQIVDASRGWNAGDNMGYSNYFGEAYDYDVRSCDATAFGNEPGVGWNYCWSDNTTQGYVYAPGEGSLIYRFVNAHDGSVDSSNVAAGTQFYHPDDSFSNLIGCPLNGSWYIEVQDGWSSDNGYIFGWELSLSNEMLPDVTFELDYSTADGPWVTPLSDTLFQVDPPVDLAHDTTIAYTFTVYDTTGCGYDTTIYITFFATPHAEFDTTVCGSFTWNDSVYTQSGQYVQFLVSASGCDSVVTLNLTVNTSSDTTLNVAVLENNLPYLLNGISYDTSGTYNQTIENVLGCDSNITIHLTVYYNVATTADSTVCDSELPLIWNGLTCDTAGVYTSFQTSANGADSTAYLTLTVNYTSENTLTVTVLENNLPFTLNDSSYTLPGTYYQHFTNAAGCDSMLTIVLTVYYNQTVEVDSTVCESALPITWNNVSFTQAGTLSDTLTTSHGADSIVVMTLNVLPSPEAVISGLVALCSDSVVTLTADSAYSYLWSTGDTTRIITVTGEGAYTLTVTNEYGCTATATHYLMPLGNPIISVTVPEMCAGGSYLLSVGFQSDNNIHLGQGATTLSLTDTIYLPDGVYCEPFGCSYRSPLTFTAYADGDTIQTADDIYYVRLNMEHSFVGDLYINITCPNGQKADLLKYGGSGNSSCNSQIVSSSRGWAAGSNCSVGNYFGEAYDYDVSSCDATAFGNEPGVGWNYCWSNNTTQGYVYAPGEGSLIYRFVNAHDGSVDSSNVAAGTQFYHPDDSFSNLIGCPLNGSWYIEVQDGWSSDNGYIFGWELSLSNEMLPDVTFELDYSTVAGPWVTTLSDTLFQVDPPADLAHDTTIAYTFTVYDTTGCGYDTTIYITFYATPHAEFDTMVCGSFTWNDNVYTQSGQYVQHLASASGCDSVVTCQLTVGPLASTYDTLTLLENQLPYDFALANTTFTMQSPLVSSTSYTLTSSQGCDSVVLVTVYIYHNVATQVDTTVCAASLPITWHGHSYTAAGSFTTTLLTTNGADSVVTYTLTVDEVAATVPTVTHVTCYGGNNGAATATVTGGMPNFAYAWTNAEGASVSTSTSISNQPAGTYTFTVTDMLGCTATATVTLNTLNGELQPGTIAEDQDVCEGELPLPFTGTAASGGDNGAYQWQMSTNGTDWTVAPGTNNAQNYTYPNVPTAGFSLRRAWVSQSCGTVYSNIVTISLWPNSSDTIEGAVCIGDVYQENGFNITADQTAEAGVYTFEQHFATGHCDSMVVLVLTVNPHYEIELEDVVCEGDGYHDNGFSISPLETVGEGNLTRTLTLHTAAGCDSVVTLHLRVIDTAVSIVSLTPDFCENLTAELMVVTDMPNYEWSTGETAPSITVTQSGRYYVTATSGDCSSTAHITVESCDGNQLLLPNAITPSNHDGLNDYFSIPERNLLYINLFEIWIYNRWGELVYYSNDKNFHWNGEYRDKIQYGTVYDYIIRYTNAAGKPEFVKGSVTVL